LITEKQPYHGKNFGDLIKIVSVEKPKPGVNRPDFVDDMSPKLKQLIKSCWDTKPDVRPGFAQLDKEKAWEVSLEDRDSGYAANIKKLFHEKDGSDKKTFKFGAFVRELAQYLHESKNLHITDPDKGPFDSIYIRTLQAALGLKKATYQVEWQQAERLIYWVNQVDKTEVLSTLYAIFNNPYFFGIMETPEIQEVMEKSPKSGTYCVCWIDHEDSFVICYIPPAKGGPEKGGGMIGKIVKQAGKGGRGKVQEASGPKELTIHVKKLGVKSIGDLDAAVQKTLPELKILPTSVVANKPARLAGLKIKDQFITSLSAYTIDSRPKAGEKSDDKNVDTSLTHYHFVL